MGPPVELLGAPLLSAASAWPGHGVVGGTGRCS